MTHIPTEILEQILELALWQHPALTSILLTCSTFHSIGSKLLYNDLCFTSASQLLRFLACFDGARSEFHSTHHIPHPPKTMTFLLSTDISTRLFVHIHQVLLLYHKTQRPIGTEIDTQGRLVLKKLHFAFNTHIKDSTLWMVGKVLGLVKYVSLLPFLHHFTH